VIQVCDREADIYLFVKRIIELAQCFVIRCAYKNRTTESGNIMDEIKRAKKVGRTEIKIEKNGTRKERVARVEIKRCRCMIKAPTIMNRKGKPLPLNIVIVEEISNTGGQEKLEWILLTGEPIETFEDCMKVVGYYKSRWQIEEFHKTLKSGCKIEERQIESTEGLIKVLSLFSIVAYQIFKDETLSKM